jgi:phosphoribosyl-ATP pyrophosphohydrolase
MNGDREAVVRESSDLLYNLVVLWAEAGVRPQDVFAEMARRERLFGLAEKLPKKHVEITNRRKVVLLDSRRKSRRR